MAGTYQNGHRIVGTVYRVVRHIGAGGMGSLYEVEDTTVGRHYVLKTLQPELLERGDLAVRMQQEARALGRLNHPNIVEVITAGVTGDSLKVPFYVMERLVGQNLRTVIDARRGMPGGVGVLNAYRIAIDVLSALQHAHDSAMVHRDVKPENIFLHRGPDGVTVTKLLDFGIVRMLNREATLTRGKFLGTLRYSSPEQITGACELGPASDIYSLALVLYELLAGRGPFDEERDPFKVGAAHAGVSPPPPSRFRHVAPDVERLLLQALEKQPEKRPASAGLFAQELRRALHEFETTPSHSTEVDLLTAHHPLEKSVATVATGSATLTSPTGGALNVPSSTIPDPPATPVATRLEGAGNVAVADTELAPQTPVMPVVSASPPKGIDREAPTRISPLSQPNVIVAPNDTQIDASVRRTTPMDGRPATPAPGASAAVAASASPRPPKIDQRLIPTFHTRPRKDRAIIALLAAAFVALAMIAGAFLLVRGRLTMK